MSNLRKNNQKYGYLREILLMSLPEKEVMDGFRILKETGNYSFLNKERNILYDVQLPDSDKGYILEEWCSAKKININYSFLRNFTFSLNSFYPLLKRIKMIFKFYIGENFI